MTGRCLLRFPLHLLLLLVFAPAWGSGPGIAEDRAAQASRRILTVGPGRALKNPSDAARLARDGTLVMIDAGSYLSDTAVWRQNDLTLVGTGGMAKLMSRGQVAEGKAIWVIKGDRVRVENIEFADARSDAFNGAGIRFEGTDLTLRNCGFHDNQMGILTGANPHSTIRIEGSEFYRNTVDYQRHGRLGHNIYVGRVRRFVLRDSHIHSAETGHQVKSRADKNFFSTIASPTNPVMPATWWTYRKEGGLWSWETCYTKAPTLKTRQQLRSPPKQTATSLAMNCM